ncbi:MAG: 4-phosphoerythronate dehydrogenase PdxB [Bacteroidales bacterium]
MRIVADDKIPFLRGVLEPFAEIEYYPGHLISSQTVKNADALIIRTRTNCNAELLNGSKVKFIATATIGFDHIDTTCCNSAGIKWTNAPGCNSGSVMQYIASAIMVLSQKYNFRLAGKTLGVVGHGNVGSKVAKMAKTLGMNVLINDPPLQRRGLLENAVSLNEIIEKADIISFHVPLNMGGQDNTFHLAGKDFFKQIKPGKIILNSSRGEIVDETFLKQGLYGKKIKSAVLDVWNNEPEIDRELLNLVDFATPHIAGYSLDGKSNGTAMSVQAVSRFFGLGLDNWFPEEIPEPENKILKTDRKSPAEEMVREIILQTYDIRNDDRMLKTNPAEFEKLRGNYPIRREFFNYLVSADNDQIKEVFSLLGFKI